MLEVGKVSAERCSGRPHDRSRRDGNLHGNFDGAGSVVDGFAQMLSFGNGRLARDGIAVGWNGLKWLNREGEE